MQDGTQDHVEALKAGQTIRFRPRGNSMRPRIESGQLVTVAPCALGEAQVGDIVLCKVDGKQWLHLVHAIGADGRYQIGNNRGHINGWATPDNVFGIVTGIEV